MRTLVRGGAQGADAVESMCQRLARLGVEDVVVLPPGPGWAQLEAVAAGLSGRTLLVDADLIVADASLGQLVDDPAVRSGALVDQLPSAGPASRRDPGTAAAPVRVAHRRIGSAGSAWHEVTGATHTSLGALVIDAEDAGAAALALTGAADAAHRLGWAEVDPVDLALVALVRAQVPMAAVAGVGPVLRGGSPEQRAQVSAELAGIDEARVLLERANRPDDGFYSTYVLRRASTPLTALAVRRGWSPNQVSVFSLGVGLLAALSFAIGSWPALLAGALLMQASLVIDCVDGEVARFTRSFSDLGAWIDASSDRVKEYAAYAGLALGSARSGTDIWLLAVLVMGIQTVRHIGDYNFSRVQRIREGWVRAHPIEDPRDGGAGGAGATLAISAQLNRSSRFRWVKKVVSMPIGERWLVLSVGTVTIGARATLLVLLGLGLLALTYTTAARVLRARSWHHPPERSGAWLLRPQLDLGPLGQPLWQAFLGRRDVLAGAFGWAWPAGLRAFELGAVWLAALLVAPERGGLLFAWVFVVVFHHYDTLYRALGGATPPRWLIWAGLGWDGRTLLVLGAGIIGAQTLTALLGFGSLSLGLLFVVVGSAQWVGSMNRKDGAHV